MTPPPQRPAKASTRPFSFTTLTESLQLPLCKATPALSYLRKRNFDQIGITAKELRIPHKFEIFDWPSCFCRAQQALEGEIHETSIAAVGVDTAENATLFFSSLTKQIKNNSQIIIICEPSSFQNADSNVKRNFCSNFKRKNLCNHQLYTENKPCRRLWCALGIRGGARR